MKKALYVLRRPRAWYNKIKSYFAQENFMKCAHEHSLFLKNNSEGKMLILSLYVDNLIYIGDDIAITDMGRMRYFLGVEVKQNDEGIFISQSKYIY